MNFCRQFCYFMLLFILSISISACGGSSDQNPPTDGDQNGDLDETSPDGDAIPDGDAETEEANASDGDAETDIETDADMDPEPEGERCSSIDAPYCFGSLLYYCGENDYWQVTDCSPGTCKWLGAEPECIAPADGDEEPEMDAEEGTECDPYMTPFCSDDVLISCKWDGTWIFNNCDPGFCDSSQNPPACVGDIPDGDPEFVELEDEIGPDVDGDEDADLDAFEADTAEMEEESGPQCQWEEASYCEGNLLIYCDGHNWNNQDCSPQQCVEHDGYAACEGLADGDYDTDAAFACEADMQAGGPRLSVDRRNLAFGMLFPGEYVVHAAQLCNNGSETLNIDSAHLFGYGPGAFQLWLPSALPLQLAPGESVELPVYGGSSKSGIYADRIILHSNDDENNWRDIPLNLTVPPVARLASPERLRFPFGSLSVVSLTVINTGERGMSITNAQVLGSVFQIDQPFTNTVLNPGMSSTIRIGSIVPNPSDTQLLIQWSDDLQQKETFVTLTTDTEQPCSQATLGGDLYLRPGGRLYLDGLASSDIDGIVNSYKWSLQNRPGGTPLLPILNRQGEDIRDIWSDEATPMFTTSLPGSTYTVALQVRSTNDTCNNSDSVTQPIISHFGTRLGIALSWSNPAADLDLHLIRPNGTFTRNNADNESDCHKANCRSLRNTASDCPLRGCPGPAYAPDWGETGLRLDDPLLITPPDAPQHELLTLDTPAVGEYQVVIENNAQLAPADYFLTVQVSDASVYAADRSFSGSYCQHQVVATIHVASDGGITVTEQTGQAIDSGCE